MPFSDEMTREAARFVTKTTEFVPSGAGWKRILQANPRRWYLYTVDPNAGAKNPRIYPGPPLKSVATLQQAGAEQPYKFRDCPSVVTGEFYYFDDNLATLWVVEVIYTGE